MKVVVGAITSSLILVNPLLAQQEYASTDCERLSRQVQVIKADLSSKAMKLKQITGDVTFGRTSIESAMAALKEKPGDFKAQEAVIEAVDERAAKLELIAGKALSSEGDSVNPVPVLGKLLATLEELAALCETDARQFEAKAQNATTESLKQRYLLLAASAERNARTYRRNIEQYKGLDIAKQYNELLAEKEFLGVFRDHLGKLIPNLRALGESQEILKEIESLTSSLDQLAQAYSDFSKVISETFESTEVAHAKKAD
ncbi:MAG: hypothetical protein H6819_02215 [Phycisphaerales bacterium]|nr:hypothetical protein [Phycisphaerales bacterium]MCB9856972.1 hypothetical protein [Phycisphaerales bacterium]MCB9861901.1 hypothetical protein [Phycisphaerales bacterium]